MRQWYSEAAMTGSEGLASRGRRLNASKQSQRTYGIDGNHLRCLTGGMKIPHALLALLFLTLSASGAETKLFEQLAVTETDFAITFDDFPLEVSAQGITLRAVSEQKSHDLGKDAKQVNDFAYRAYHLEFAFNRRYKVREQFSVVEFYEGNDVVHRIALQKPSRKITTTNGRPYETNFVAISLEGVPLVLLDSVTRINFSRSD
jgi:hypothetical protein